MLRVIGLDSATKYDSTDEGSKIIAEHVRRYSTNELEMMYRIFQVTDPVRQEALN